MDHTKSLATEADILGTYSCQGEVNPKVLEKAKSKPEPPVWIADALDLTGDAGGVRPRLIVQG